VTGERVRGAVLYSTAVALVAAGSAWWVGAAPRDDADTRVAQWRQNVRELLPDLATQETSDTVTLVAGIDREVDADVGTGEFVVAVVCAGGQESQVRVTLGEPGEDTGRGVVCWGDRQPDTFSLSLGGPLHMNVSVNDAGPVVFRYALWRSG
jgi:hypothetical protein